MTVKGTIGIIVLVIPHIELFSRHQDVQYFSQISLLRTLVTQVLHPTSAIGELAGLKYVRARVDWRCVTRHIHLHKFVYDQLHDSFPYSNSSS